MRVNIWLIQQDLRLRDNPALIASASAGAAVIPLFIWDPVEPGTGTRRGQPMVAASFVGETVG